MTGRVWSKLPVPIEPVRKSFELQPLTRHCRDKVAPGDQSKKLKAFFVHDLRSLLVVLTPADTHGPEST